MNYKKLSFRLPSDLVKRLDIEVGNQNKDRVNWWQHRVSRSDVLRDIMSRTLPELSDKSPMATEKGGAK
tara:strand:- start:7497 stop:7703 length:207 start_codon:yes stop_codon:yes gene_type:complete